MININTLKNNAHKFLEEQMAATKNKHLWLALNELYLKNSKSQLDRDILEVIDAHRQRKDYDPNKMVHTVVLNRGRNPIDGVSKISTIAEISTKP